MYLLVHFAFPLCYFVYVCVCVCVCEREWESEWVSERERVRELSIGCVVFYFGPWTDYPKTQATTKVEMSKTSIHVVTFPVWARPCQYNVESRLWLVELDYTHALLLLIELRWADRLFPPFRFVLVVSVGFLPLSLFERLWLVFFLVLYFFFGSYFIHLFVMVSAQHFFSFYSMVIRW